MIQRTDLHQWVCSALLVSGMLVAGPSSPRSQASQGPAQAPHLVFSTFLGGSTACADCSDIRTWGLNAASDARGNTYLTGGTKVSDLPVLHAWQNAPAANSRLSAFVAKYDPEGALLWCTYLGGNSDNMGIGVAVMPDGGVAVAGMTEADGSEPFPTLRAFQDHNNGQTDYFVTVFDANGVARYSTYLGGSAVDGESDPFSDDNTNGNNIAADSHGLVYVTGFTQSAGIGGVKFPVTPNAIQNDMWGPSDAFLTILDPSKSGADSLVYSSFLGGHGDEKGHGVAVNGGGGKVTVVGYTNSPDLPTTADAYRPQPPPQGWHSNGFVAQIKSNKPGKASSRYTMRYCTYLGGDSDNSRDDVYGVVVDAEGIILATGRTVSADFPMTKNGPSIYDSAPFLIYGQSNDQPFLVKINPSLKGKASLLYATFLGGGGFCSGVAVDGKGRAWIAGEETAGGVPYVPRNHAVESPQLFPTTQDALIPSYQGAMDGILMKTNTKGSKLKYSTYLGGTGNDRAYGVALDAKGNVVVTGVTSSEDFPLKNPAQTWPGGTQNAFIAKFSSVDS